MTPDSFWEICWGCPAYARIFVLLSVFDVLSGPYRNTFFAYATRIPWTSWFHETSWLYTSSSYVLIWQLCMEAVLSTNNIPLLSLVYFSKKLHSQYTLLQLTNRDAGCDQALIGLVKFCFKMLFWWWHIQMKFRFPIESNFLSTRISILIVGPSYLSGKMQNALPVLGHSQIVKLYLEYETSCSYGKLHHETVV